MNKLHSIGPFRRLLFLGGGELLRDLAEWAQAAGFEVSVLTAPRHAEEPLSGTTFLDHLTRKGIKVRVAESLTTSVLAEALREPATTFSLSLGAAWVFTQEMISTAFAENLYNLHGTRLPQFRGGGGFSWQILTGNRFGYCILHKLEAGLDEGDIVLCHEFLYPHRCRTPADFSSEYIDRSRREIVRFLESTMRSATPIQPISQPEYLSTYWPRLSTNVNGWIDWRWTPEDLERFICAFDDPYSGAQTLWNGKPIRLKKATLSLQDGYFHPFQSGIVFRKTADWMCVAAGAYSLVIEEAFDEGGRSVLGAVRVGDRLNTPSSQLDDSLRRVVYTATGLKA